MYEIPLHIGIEHPNLLWIVVSSLLSFGAGLGLGLYADRGSDPKADTVSESERR